MPRPACRRYVEQVMGQTPAQPMTLASLCDLANHVRPEPPTTAMHQVPGCHVLAEDICAHGGVLLLLW